MAEGPALLERKLDDQRDDWNDRRAARKHRADVPFDDLAANKNKALQLREARQNLRAEFDRASPDVLIVFGDDQIEQFDFNNFPALSVYVGAEIGRAHV